MLGLPLETRKLTWTFGRPVTLGNTTLGSSSPANPAFILSDPLSITIAGGPSLSSGASHVKAEIGLSPDASFTSVGASEVLSTGTVAAIMWWKICRAISHYTTWYFHNSLPAGHFLFVVCCFFLSKSIFLNKNPFRDTIRVSNNLDPDKARHFVGPYLVSNCLQRSSTDDTSRQKVYKPGTILHNT